MCPCFPTMLLRSASHAAHVQDTGSRQHVLFLCLQAVDALTTMCGKVVPVKKLLLWLEMARQDLPPGTKKIPLMQWHKVLRDLSS